MAAGQGFKTFATGDVLTAPDVNGYLMQGVLVFASAAARTAAITSPQQGQVSFLKDTNSTEYYTGSAWSAIGGGGGSGLTLVKTQTIGSGVSTVTVTDAFSATYDNYQIMISGGVASTSSNLNLKLGSTTTGYYVAGFYNYANNGSLAGDSYNNTSSFVVAASGSANNLNGIIYLQGPNLAKFTNVQYANQRTATADSIAYRALGFEASTTQHTAFTLDVSSGTITGGTIKVYGYQNS